MRLGIVIPTDEPISKSPVPDSEAQGEKEIVAFRESLNAPGVRFSLRRIGKPNTPLNSASGPDATPDRAPTFYVGKETISAEVDRRAAGIAATASMRASEALKSWQERSNIEAMALLLRSFFVIGVGLFLVQQLRRREAAEAELVSAKENAESGSRAKSEFLANMSHELRTPLNAIIGFAEIMKNRTFGSLSERYLDYVGDIYNSGTHLLALINDILNLSKLEAGQLELQEKEVDIRDAIADCIRLVETQARQSNIRLSVSLTAT